MNKPRHLLRFTCLVLALIIVGIGLFALFWPAYPPWVHYHEKTELPTDLVAAEARWKDHAIAHYNLVIFRESEPAFSNRPSCEQDFEVSDEEITKTNADSCRNSSIPYLAQPPMTVSALFKLLEHDSTEIRWGHNVDCGDMSVVANTYDPQYGYPTSIHYGWEFATPASMGWNTYRQYRGSRTGFSCLTNYIPNKGNITVTLIPLP
ncbi:MAG TPA: DUF6174 domain-containing protein [Aggregatilineales bacterium]|nr:DUF6174 domain-containing protein [Aggregatilineales bacterium]